MTKPGRCIPLATLAALLGALHPTLARAEGPDVPATYTPPPPPVPTTSTTDPAVAAATTTDAPSHRTVAFVFAGLAVVGVGVGTTFGILALNGKSDFERTPTVAGANTANQEAILADVAFGVAAIAAVTSVVLFVRDDGAGDASSPKPASPVSFQFAPIVSPHGGGAGALLRF